MNRKYALKSLKNFTCCLLMQMFFLNSFSQYKEYKLSVKKDTINAIDLNNLKQGKWVISVPEIRGEQGYEEEGIFKDGKKEGLWRIYDLNSDLTGAENYRFGGKDGLQQYFTRLGDLVREENWRAYNPDSPYDTIAVYGGGNDEITSYKIVKAEQYSVKNGEWKFYDPSNGHVIKTEMYDRGHLEIKPVTTALVTDTPKLKAKPQEVLEFEKKNSKKKKVILRQGQTGL